MGKSILIILFSLAIIFSGVYYFMENMEKQKNDSNNTSSQQENKIENKTEEEPENTNQPEKEEPFVYKDKIKLSSPLPEDKISSPLKISGQARGTWYFEANFPIVLTDWDGRIIAEGYGQAQGDWMTEEFVPFEAELEFDRPEMADQYPRGALILKKANPSGLPENDDALEVTIFYE